MCDGNPLAERYRPEFPIFESVRYLNSCSLGALSRRARVALDEFAELWSRQGAAAWYEHWLAATDDVRARFARLVGARTDEVALAPSVSGALATVTSGIDFGARPRVVTTELDFPTVVYQFLAKRRLGVETIVLRSPDGVSVPVRAFEEAVDDRTALVATSHVYYTTGAIQEVSALAEIAHRRGALCLIDAYQSTGQIPTNVRELDVDVLVTGGLKWLLGGPGLALLYIRSSLIERLHPTVASWFGVVDPFEFDPHRLQLRGDARRFELGTPAVPTVYTTRAGLEIVTEIGAPSIREAVSKLTEDLIGRAGAAGLRVRAAARREQRAAIVMIPHPEPEAAVRRLADLGVIADWRGDAVRLSPHFYNTREDNAVAVRALAGSG